MNYKIIIDSTTDLPQDIIDQYNMKVVPLSVVFGEDEFFNLTPDEFYNKLEVSETLPITSQITPDRFMTAFKEELDKGNKVICITIGSNASGTYQSACIAKDEIDSDDIILIDSNMLCLGTGYLVLKVARMLEKGENIEDIMKIVEFYTGNNIEHLFCVDTLKYLKKGGRIKGSKAAIAEVLNIKPILNVDNAVTQTLGKVRGRKKVIPYFVKHIQKTMDDEKTEYILIGHSQDYEFAKSMEQALREEIGYNKEIIISDIGAIIGTHAGPGVLSVFYIKK